MSYMDTIKLKSAEEIVDLLEAEIPYEITYERPYIIEAIQIAQKDAIEKTLQTASKNADADVYFHGWLAEESMKSGEPFVEGEDYEAYVINSSITGLKDKIFEENNL